MKQRIVPTFSFNTDINLDPKDQQEIILPEPELKKEDTTKIVNLEKPSKLPDEGALW